MNSEALKSNIIKILDEDDKLKELLFSHGFLLTDNLEISGLDYPFYNLWKTIDCCGYRFFLHKKQKIYLHSLENKTIVLVGHAYNPISKEVLEQDLIKNALDYFVLGEKEFTEYFNMWTGSYVLFIFDGDKLRIYGDAAGMYTVFYGTHQGNFYCSSHTKLIGDICNLNFDPYVKELINYRFYHLFGKTLPGDITPYKDFRRLIPNHFVDFIKGSFQKVRFFPTKDNGLYYLTYEEIVEKAADILSSSMQIIHQKWNNAAISLTGGCDSKTTLSCTNGAYDKYKYFSYISSDSEKVDAVAASQICDMLGVKHCTYKISDNDDDYNNTSAIGTIMEYNGGCIGRDHPNEIRKRVFFITCEDFDVEVKSWVSEVARAYYHKRFDKKSFPKKLTAKYATNLYKVFITNRKLIRKTDEIFEEFLNTYYTDNDFKMIPWYDLFFWEFRMSSWNGLAITGEHQVSNDITIPYNNRYLLQLMLSTDIENRVEDKIHKDIIRLKNEKIADCNISVVNVKHTKKRAKLEKLYLEVFSRFRL